MCKLQLLTFNQKQQLTLTPISTLKQAGIISQAFYNYSTYSYTTVTVQ